MKIRFATFLVVTLIFLTLGWFATEGFAAVIFQDDFETSSSTWKCTDRQGDGPSAKWSSGWTTCGSTTGFGAEWKMGAGYNSNNALYAWKKSGVPNGYRSESNRWLTGSDVKTEIYHRWYMKIPTAANFNKACTDGFKFWRYVLRENGFPRAPELYLNVRSNDQLVNGDLVTIHFLTGGQAVFNHLINFNEINDNQWHCHELRIKLNSNGQSDGIIQYWLDGTMRATHANQNFAENGVTNLGIHRFGVGVGNVSDSDWYQTAWSAIAFDNIVVSTTYVGPEGGEAPPSPPPTPPAPITRTMYLNEGFDDTNYAARGWYDYSSPVIDTSTRYSGSGSLRHDFTVGSNGPTGIIRRHAIIPTDSAYVKFYVRFSSGWRGFGGNSPHMVYLLTTADDAYSSLARAHTTGYIEVNGSSSNVHIPTLKLQDALNVNTGYVNVNLCGVTENRAVNGCNGDCDMHGGGCYNDGVGWNNARVFPYGSSIAVDPNWHKVEAYFKMNTISGGVGQANGQLKMWWDGVLVVNHEDLIIRTGQNPTMKWNQIVIAPWGSASPAAQTFWIDELEVANLPPSGSEPTPPPSSPVTPPAAPTGLRILTQ